jgi:hypothetical protein
MRVLSVRLWCATKASLAMLDEHEVRYRYKETEGGHTWPNWRAYLNEFAPLLFRSLRSFFVRLAGVMSPGLTA